MADNFLEKRMDDYRRGVLGGRRNSLVGSQSGMLGFRMPRKVILVAGAISDDILSAVRQLSESGCKIAFIGSDRKRGAAVAQSTGALFYPVNESLMTDSICRAAEFVAERWGALDNVIIPACSSGVNSELVHFLAEKFGGIRYITLDCSDSVIAALDRENFVAISAADADESATAALVAFFVLPVTYSISGKTFELK